MGDDHRQVTWFEVILGQEVLDVGDDRGGDELVNGPAVLVEGVGLGVVGGGDSG